MLFDSRIIHPASIHVNTQTPKENLQVYKEEFINNTKKYSFDAFYLLILIIVIIGLYESELIDIQDINYNNIYIYIIIAIIIIEFFFIKYN
jgi:hypothetical protein